MAGHGGGVGNEPEEGQASIPGHQGAGDREQGNKHLLLIRW